MLSNFNMFEHSESYKKYIIGPFDKNVKLKKSLSLIFFVKFTKIGISLCFYHYCKVQCIALNKNKKLDIYFIFDCSVWFISTIDLRYIY